MVSLNAFIGAVYVPMAISLIYNFVVLGAIVHSIRSRRKNVLTKTKSRNMQIIRIVLFLTFLLGLTWAFSIFVILSKHVAFQYIFAVLNTLQGFFIFCFHIARSEEVRKSWVETFKSSKRSTDISRVEEIALETKKPRPTSTASSRLSSVSTPLNLALSGGGVTSNLARQNMYLPSTDA